MHLSCICASKFAPEGQLRLQLCLTDAPLIIRRRKPTSQESFGSIRILATWVYVYELYVKECNRRAMGDRFHSFPYPRFWILTGELRCREVIRARLVYHPQIRTHARNWSCVRMNKENGMTRTLANSMIF